MATMSAHFWAAVFAALVVAAAVAVPAAAEPAPAPAPDVVKADEAHRQYVQELLHYLESAAEAGGTDASRAHLQKAVAEIRQRLAAGEHMAAQPAAAQLGETQPASAGAHAALGSPATSEGASAGVPGALDVAEADWIIVGAGASGCAAAAALVDAGEQVLVLERGRSDLELTMTQQATTWPAVVNTKAAQILRWTDGTWGGVANVLGGGTAVNAGLFIEEQPDWFQGALGADVDLDSLYASSRYLAANLTTVLQPSSYGLDYATALQEVGIAASNALQPQVRWSDGAWVGHSTIDTAEPGWPRRGAAALLHDREHMPNLQVLTEYLVQKVVFEGTKATGVLVARRGHVSFLAARKGVVLAAGAVFTPQLLQLSGIGEPDVLANLGVKPVVTGLPVGKNFIDRPVVSVGVWSGVDLPLSVGYAVAASKRKNLTFETEAGGRVASEFTIASLAFAPPAQRTDLLRWTFELLFQTPLADMFNNMMQLVALQHSPLSRGQVTAVSADAGVPPSVTANHLSHPQDIVRQLAALEELLGLAGSAALARYAKPKLWFPPFLPLPDFLSCFMQRPAQATWGIVFPCLPAPGSPVAGWYNFLRNTIVSSYHYFGTAAVGTVVDGPDFLVKGTDNLHVVDASIFPTPTRVNPQGTIMAVGHYAGKRLAKLGQRRLASEGPTGTAPPGAILV